MFEDIPFSREAKIVYVEAADMARQVGKPIDSAHLLLAIFTVTCEAQSILLEKKIDPDRILDSLAGIPSEPPETIRFIFATASQIAQNVGSSNATSVHLLMAISKMTSCRAARVLEASGLPLYAVRTKSMAHLTDPRLRRSALEKLVTSTQMTVRDDWPRSMDPAQSTLPSQRTFTAPQVQVRQAPLVAEPSFDDDDIEVIFESFDDDRVDSTPEVTPEPFAKTTVEEHSENSFHEHCPNISQPRKTGRYALSSETYPVLTSLGRNLTLDAENGLIDPLVGRQEQLDAIVDILGKRRSNNPLLLGDPGVGKTALVEGLAKLMVEKGKSLPGLGDKVLISLSVADLVAGTEMRGAFSARLKSIKDEVSKSNGQIVLFIDEIHTIIGAGMGDGGMDAANDLKGALARGEFPCIGATTYGEYKRYIQSDPALQRRFEPVTIREPSIEEAESILAGVAPRYSEFHSVEFTEDALRTAVRLTDRVVPDRALPAKAIDVLDRAGARVRRDGRSSVGRDDVIEVLATLVDLPKDFLTLSPGRRMHDLEKSLKGRVFGHDDAIETIVRILARNWSRYGSRRPMGAFVFAGEDGVGKRTLARSMAAGIFGSEDAILDIDGSDYGEAHSLSNLIGSPPGYVGHEEGGILADTLIRRPFLLVQWQHPEKAHPSVQGLILQILTEGSSTDRRGRRMDFRNTIHVFMIEDASMFLKGGHVGFAPSSTPADHTGTAEFDRKLQKILPSDLIRAMDASIGFRRPSFDTMVLIARLILTSAVRSFHDEHGVTLAFDDNVAHSLASQSGTESIDSRIAKFILRPAGDLAFSRNDDSSLDKVIRVTVTDSGEIRVVSTN